jgi:hypothetical protein
MIWLEKNIRGVSGKEDHGVADDGFRICKEVFLRRVCSGLIG